MTVLFLILVGEVDGLMIKMNIVLSEAVSYRKQFVLVL